MVEITYNRKRAKKLVKLVNSLILFLFVFLQFFPLINIPRVQKIPQASAEVAIDSTVHTTLNLHKNQPSLVFTSGTVGYKFYTETTGTIGYSKTTDGGGSWGAYQATTAQTDIVAFSIWYEQWTPGDTTGTVVHILMMDSGNDDVWYDTFNTSGDSNGTEVAISTVFGNTVTNADQGTIAKATDGVLNILASNGTTTGITLQCSTTCSTAGNWSAAGTTPLDAANDYIRLVPLASGNMMVVRDDISLEDIGSKVYTTSTDTWDAGWNTFDNNAADSTTYLETIAVTVHKTNNDVYVAYGSSVAVAAAADVKVAVYSGGAWTIKTDVITNQSTTTNLSIAIRDGTDDLYVGYLRGTAGSSMNAYFKLSTDGGTNWGSETQINSTTQNADLRWMYLNVLSDKIIYAAWEYNATTDTMYGAVIAEFGVITVAATGTQTSSMNSATSNNYVGGAFTAVRDFGTADITQIKVSENGTVNANSNLSNLDLYYETAGTCTYNGTETLFGTAASFDGSDDATVTGTLTVTTSQICIYAVLDVGAGISNGQTLEIEITNPSTDVTVSKGTATPASAISISGTTTLSLVVISITLNTDGTVPYGIVTLSSSQTTLAISDTQVAKNDGTGAEDFNIKTSNATGGTTWTLGASSGTNQYVHEFSTNGGGAWTKFTTADSYQLMSNSVSVNGTVNVDLRITLPSSTSDYNQKSITVTIQAVAD